MINWWVLRLFASQSRLFNARCHSLCVTIDSLTARAHTQTLHRDNDKHRIIKDVMRAWVAACVCLVSHCRVCVMRLAPFFHNTWSCSDSTHGTERFMALKHSTLLCCWLWHVYIHCTVWTCVSCTVHPPCMCVCAYVYPDRWWQQWIWKCAKQYFVQKTVKSAYLLLKLLDHIPPHIYKSACCSFKRDSELCCLWQQRMVHLISQ